MKSVRLYAPGDLQCQEEPLPIVGDGEKLIQVKAVGICGSDLHWFDEGGIGDAQLDHPMLLGHEFSGVTENGQPVAVDPAVPCERCEFCQRGHPNLCSNLRFAGHGPTDGAMREFMAWNEKCLFPMPETLSYADGAMLEPLGVAIHAVDLAHLKAGMTVGVFGCGPIGLMIIQLARLSGAVNIIATDPLPWRVDAARAFGAAHTFLVEGSTDHAAVHAAAGKRGVDIAFEVAGAQDAVDTAVDAVIPGGKVILVGIPDDDKTTFSASGARRKGLTVKWVRRMKLTYPRALSMVSQGLVDVRSIVTHRFPLEKTVEAFQVAKRREGLKVMIEV